jgi:hypothetical protein
MMMGGSCLLLRWQLRRQLQLLLLLPRWGRPQGGRVSLPLPRKEALLLQLFRQQPDFQGGPCLLLGEPRCGCVLQRLLRLCWGRQGLPELLCSLLGGYLFCYY